MDKYAFVRVPRANIGRSSFNMDYTYKTTFNAGKLIPVYLEEVLPGDSWNCHVNAFCRLTAPLQVPILDNLYLDMQFFFIPTRLVWDNWEKFNGARDNPNDSTDFLVPQSNTDSSVGANVGSLMDYFGIPTGVPNLKFNNLPFRAYWLVWDTWYRDENLQNSMQISKDDSHRVKSDASQSSLNWVQCAPRGKRKDYFTSCLPWPQKGPGVELPLGTTAPIIGNGNPITFALDNYNTGVLNLSSSLNGSTMTSGLTYKNSVTPLSTVAAGTPLKLIENNSLVSDSGMVADLSGATAATINSLRMAFAMQHLFEVDARGTRYIELLYAHFGVVSPDARLQIPEYLGGFSQPMIVNPVAQTSSTDSNSPQGNLSAYGVASASEHGFTKSFVEHGYLLGLASVRADLTYAQGLNRLWSRRTREDFYLPSLAHLGEQAVLNKEIYAQGTAEDDQVFGYQERWSEYRFHPNMVTGLMRPQAPNNLSVWNLTQNFAALPRLNSEFIIENPPMDRVSAVPSEPDFMLDLYFNQVAARPMPVYSVPAHLGGF